MTRLSDAEKQRRAAERRDEKEAEDQHARAIKLRKAGQHDGYHGCNYCGTTGSCGCYHLDHAEDFADLDEDAYDDDKLTMDVYMEEV